MGTRHLVHRIIAATATLAVLLVFAPPAATLSETTDVAVAVHRDVPVDGLTMAELRRIVIGDREFWPGSLRVTLLLRAPVSHERDVVVKNVSQMSEGQFRQHWIGKVFRADTAVGPKIVYSPEMSVDLVNRTPGAITFIDFSNATRSLKVLKIDGKLPGESGYPLH